VPDGFRFGIPAAQDLMPEIALKQADAGGATQLEWAALPTAREARLLGIGRDEPCLVVQRRTVGKELPITSARLVHPGTRYLLQGEFKP